MKWRASCILILCSLLLTACTFSIGDTQEEIVETEVVYVMTYDEMVEEYMEEAYAAYKDEIGETTAGERIVILTDNITTREYSVYLFDNTGYYHDYYLFAYEHDDYIYNQTSRVENVSVARKSLVTDDEYQVVYYRQEYVNMGSNTYEYFRSVIQSNYENEQVRLDLDYLDEVEYLDLGDGGTSRIVGELAEYVEPEPEYEVDSAGWTLAPNSGDLFTTKKTDNGLIITGYKGSGGNKLIFPNEIDGEPVVEIRRMSPVEGIQAIEIPPSILRLNDAFTDWSELQYVFFSEGLQEITTETFVGTSVTSLSLPSTITTLGDGFYYYNGISEIQLPASLKTLNGTLRNLSIDSFIVPGTVDTIGDYAFADCTNLSVVYVEEGVSTIKATAFENCSNLQAISLPSTITTIEIGAIPGNTLLVVVEGSYAWEYAINNGYTYSLQ